MTEWGVVSNESRKQRQIFHYWRFAGLKVNRDHNYLKNDKIDGTVPTSEVFGMKNQLIS